MFTFKEKGLKVHGNQLCGHHREANILLGGEKSKFSSSVGWESQRQRGSPINFSAPQGASEAILAKIGRTVCVNRLKS